ncbi:MAG: hypothetical protein NTY38_27025, partial [Acidobacteria bacterium]|nr:hypothetical protein [Acidobacteriota bacterium]
MNRLVAVFFILALTLTAQDRQWERVKTIRQGEVVWVRYMDGDGQTEEQARMLAWTEDSLAIRIRKQDVVISRNDVRRVQVYAGKSHARGAWVGALIGLVPGVALGALAEAASGGECEGLCVTSLAVWGAGIGTGIGAA